ncbi:glycan-binding surface protein [Paracnuella aquatica]|uniref:glycan-binding surface protein n=1 Tax=Paracnuella aquatica TaxID=2268757 RepID=UPI000DEF785A|nr:glycan-binding surface protein [Paracnuella aquatica]RPD43997.1 hypothetical protein DRJ53_18045 [Paracnuella aquatica]
MKTITKTLLLFIAAFAVMGIYTSCTKDDLPNGGEPRVRYVRVTSPDSKDSLLIGAGQGQLIAIMGENLGGAVEIWFNDQKAVLTPTYITDKSILVSVPSRIPTEVTNNLKMVFANGFVLNHKFEVQISEPQVNGMLSEYVNEGDIAIIRGNYFYEPLEVNFTGGVKGELVKVEDQLIQVRVPAGAQPGPITVKTNFGETESEFWFRDNRNIFIGGDPHEGWWATYHVTNLEPGAPPRINGNYYRFTKLVKSWVWEAPEVAGGAASSMPSYSKNIPDEAILKPENYYLKFEVNTLKPYTSNRIVINAGLSAEDNNNYAWNPPYDSKGQWNTVIIPFEDIIKSYTTRPAPNPDGYWSRILIFGAGELDADIAFDNFRVVPKVHN